MPCVYTRLVSRLQQPPAECCCRPCNAASDRRGRRGPPSQAREGQPDSSGSSPDAPNPNARPKLSPTYSSRASERDNRARSLSSPSAACTNSSRLSRCPESVTKPSTLSRRSPRFLTSFATTTIGSANVLICSEIPSRLSSVLDRPLIIRPRIATRTVAMPMNSRDALFTCNVSPDQGARPSCFVHENKQLCGFSGGGIEKGALDLPKALARGLPVADAAVPCESSLRLNHWMDGRHPAARRSATMPATIASSVGGIGENAPGQKRRSKTWPGEDPTLAGAAGTSTAPASAHF